MIILQFQFIDLQEDERTVIPDFCESLKQLILSKLNTKINMKKISLRLKYIEDGNVNWVSWQSNRQYNTTTMELISVIVDSIRVVPYKNNIWKLETDNTTVIPNSYTLIDKFIRFLNYGDNKCNATGIFTNIEHEYRHQRLNALWHYFILKELGYNPESTIITV